MKKSIFLSILIIFVALSLVIVTPLVSFADIFLDSEIAWSLNGTSYSPVIHKSDNFVSANIYSYNASTGWTQGSFQSPFSITYQLPSPISSHNNLTVSSSRAVRVFGNTTSDDQSVIAFDFNLGFGNTIDLLNPSSEDFICFAVPFCATRIINSVTFSWGDIVTGNSYAPTTFFTDERMLLYDPYNKSGIGTSGIINTSLWSSTWEAESYICVLYCNIPYSAFLNYNIPDSYVPVFSVNFEAVNTGFNVYYFEPIFYKVGYNEEITLLNNISDNVQIITDVLQQGTYTPPSTYSDLSSAISHGGGNLDNKIVGALNDDDIWSALSFTYVLSGATWVGTFLAQYYNGIPFLEGIYALILFFMICALLKNGALFKVNRGDSGGSQHRKTR